VNRHFILTEILFREEGVLLMVPKQTNGTGESGVAIGNYPEERNEYFRGHARRDGPRED
jgi:hypothetical protein